MRRIQVYLVLGLAILLTAIAVFWHYRSQNSNKPTVEKIGSTNETKAQNSPLVNLSDISVTKGRSVQIGTNSFVVPTDYKKMIDTARAQSEQMTAERSKPITFYGKVVDENTQAVENANIRIGWVDPVSTSETNVTSDTGGRFSLTGVLGGSVFVDAWKDGCYEVKATKSYGYDNTGNGSSVSSPILIHLRKKGVGVDLISAALNVQIPRDGSSVSVDFLNQKFGVSGQMQTTQIKPPYDSWKKATEWSFKMEIPDGGFVEQDDEFPFEAPETGYQPTIKFEFKAGQSEWKTAFTKNYYFVFGNPRRYGNLTVQTDIMWGGARISYAINPDSSRRLEPK